MAAANNKISEMDLKAKVLRAVEDLPRTGILAQDGYTGKVYLDIVYVAYVQVKFASVTI